MTGFSSVTDDLAPGRDHIRNLWEINVERSYRLQKNKQFQYVYRRGKSAACKDLVLLYAKGSKMQVGFSVSKKVGNAVVRNRTKRRLREAFRPYLGHLKRGLYVVVARPGAGEASYQNLCKSLAYLLKKQGLQQPGGEA